MSGMEFTESTVETFMGGTFKMERPKHTKELAKFLRKIADEVESWGGDQNLALGEVHFNRTQIDVTLKDGIVQ